MKSKILCSVAAAVISFNGFANEAQFENNSPAGVKHQSLDGMNAINHNPNAEDMMIEKGFGTGNYRVLIAASGSSANYSTVDYTYGGGGCMYTSNNLQDGDLDINLQLPDGHTLLGFRYYWNDTDAGSSTARLWKFDGLGGTTNLLNITSTGDTGFGSFYTALTGGDHVIDNSTGAYVIRFDGGAGNTQEMCAVRLFIASP